MDRGNRPDIKMELITAQHNNDRPDMDLGIGIHPRQSLDGENHGLPPGTLRTRRCQVMGSARGKGGLKGATCGAIHAIHAWSMESNKLK